MTALTRANALALLLPAGLMAGALGSQYFGGLYPCEMCWWQRYPHFAAVGIATVAFLVGNTGYRRALVALAALAIATSGLIGGFHAGVEYHWWRGITACTSSVAGTSLEDLMRAPLVRCDAAQWTLFGISLAGYNALFSLGGGVAILALLRRAR